MFRIKTSVRIDVRRERSSCGRIRLRVCLAVLPLALLISATGINFPAAATATEVLDSGTPEGDSIEVAPEHPAAQSFPTDAQTEATPPHADSEPPTEFEQPPLAADTVVTPIPEGTSRLAGTDRYETAVATSQRYSPGVPAVYVASGLNFPDALAGASAAAKIGAPLLLTPPSELPPAVAAELERLAPAEIVVTGGNASVSESVTNQLAQFAPVKRIGGANRYDTGLLIVQDAFQESQFAVIASGNGFPDALAATGVAGKMQAPVILVNGPASSLPEATLDELGRLGTTSVLVAGGYAAVSYEIEQQLAGAGITISRRGGADRYETAAMINAAYFPAGSTDTMLLANGQNFPDALSGAALGGYLGAPLFITQADCIPAQIHGTIVAFGSSKRLILGGTAAVSQNAAAITKCVPPPPQTNPGGGGDGPTGPPPGSRIVTAGAFCKKIEIGQIAYTSTGVRMKCTRNIGETTPRWRAF